MLRIQCLAHNVYPDNKWTVLAWYTYHCNKLPCPGRLYVAKVLHFTTLHPIISTSAGVNEPAVIYGLLRTHLDLALP